MRTGAKTPRDGARRGHRVGDGGARRPGRPEDHAPARALVRRSRPAGGRRSARPSGRPRRAGRPSVRPVSGRARQQGRAHQRPARRRERGVPTGASGDVAAPAPAGRAAHQAEAPVCLGLGRRCCCCRRRRAAGAAACRRPGARRRSRRRGADEASTPRRSAPASSSMPASTPSSTPRRSRRRRRGRGRRVRRSGHPRQPTGRSCALPAVCDSVRLYRGVLKTPPSTSGRGCARLREAMDLSLRDLAERSGVSARCSARSSAARRARRCRSPAASPPASSCASASCCASTRRAR
jgi:hypothetical protein